MSRRGEQLHRERAKVAARFRREGLTYKQIAERLGIDDSSKVKTHVELGERLLSVEEKNERTGST